MAKKSHDVCVLEAQIISKCHGALCFCSMNSSHITLPRTNYLAVKKHVKKILDGFKSNFCFQKDQKSQNILLFQEL